MKEFIDPRKTNDPDFRRLEAKVASLSKELDEVLTEINDRWPSAGSVWAVNAANTVGLYQTFSEGDSE